MTAEEPSAERRVADPLPITPLSLVEGASMISSVAAPLLAGFALTILVIILPTTVAKPESSFTRWPEPVILLLVGSATILVNTVQAGAHARSYHFTPDEARMWFDGRMPADALANFRTKSQAVTAKWITRTRRLYQAGIVLLLLAIAVVLVPPSGSDLTVWRVAAITVALISAASELVWIVINALKAHRVSKAG